MRLEVTTDGRHITFILVSLYEAGYGVQVVGSPAVFRELICLRKSAPIPFVVGGKEYEVGISITDQPSTLDAGRSSLFVLDYDYFSGLNNAGVSHGGTANTEVGEDLGKNESMGNFNHGLHEYTRIEAEQAGLRLAGQAGAEFSNPFTSELAQDSENTSPTRSASVPAGAHIALGDRISQIGDRVTGSDGGNQSADSMEFLEGQSQAGLQTDNQKGATIRTANDHTAPGEYSSSVKFDSLDPSRLALRADLRSLHLTPAPALDCGLNASSPATSHSILATAPQAARMPYFMHPSVYHRGLHKSHSANRHTLPVARHSAEGASHPLHVTSYSPQRRRRFRLGFFGTHDREFYTKHYHFPGMNRFEILEVFLKKFGDRITPLRGFPRDWDPCEIAVSIDRRGGDRREKSFLSQAHYLKALQECDFVLSPPGWCMPISHNLIEAMFCGAIPITNGGAFMAEPLADDVNCLAFKNVEQLAAAVERALAMDAGKVARMQEAVRDYYGWFFDIKSFGERFIRTNSNRILVNAEEHSVPLIFPGKF